MAPPTEAVPINMHRHPVTSTRPIAATFAYKIIDASEWRAAVAAGDYKGSTDDLRDGFIHLSTRSQLAGTAAKFFRGQRDLLLVEFRSDDLGTELVWEPSRGGELFPHLYAELPANKALSVRPLILDENGVPIIPEGLA